MTKSRGVTTQLHVRIASGLMDDVRALARRRRVRYSQLVRSVLSREVSQADSAGDDSPDESTVREMAILVAVELVLKLQEASIPGGPTLSRRLLESAARAAIERVELVEARLRRLDEQ